MKKQTQKRRGVAFILILAMLTVTVAAILPVATSADPPEIDDFGYQTLAALNLANDDDTDLRFVFTVGKLDYDEVGFVISKSNSTPTIGGANCRKVGTETVYSTITADGTPIAAAAGRYWAAVKLTDIPHSYFDSSFYLRAFVTDGLGTRYSGVASFTVCTAAGHTSHSVPDKNMTGGTATLISTGTKIGTCPGCNLTVTLNDVKTDGIEWKYTDSTKTVHKMETSLADVLAGGKHFYPASDEGGEGQNDLIIEYSFLWNSTLHDLTGGNQVLYGSVNQDAYWMALRNNAQDCVAGSKAGGFENTALRTVEYGPAGMIHGNGSYSDYPNIGGSDEGNPEYGWHRLAFVIHEELLKTSGVSNTGDNSVVDGASYRISQTCYIDGVKIYELSNRSDPSFDASTYKNAQLLFRTTGSNAPFTYTDMSNRTIVGLEISCPKVSEGTAYAVIADYSVTAGTAFVQQVKKVASPAANVYTTADGTDIPAPFWYELDD